MKDYLTDKEAIDLSTKFNKYIRERIADSIITRAEALSLLKDIGLDVIFWGEMLHEQVVSRIGTNAYAFADTPLYFKDLRRMYVQASKKRSKYAETQRIRQRRKRGPDPAVLSAIKLLKSKGFDIYAPMGKYYEKL